MSTSGTPTTAERIVRAAATLLADGGRDAVSTRTVSSAAGVQTPTIYRLFGDMSGLFDAVASHGFSEYRARTLIPDGPVDALSELRRGFDLHVEFGLTNPAIYKLMYGSPTPGVQANFMRETLAVLRERVEGVAQAGLLRVSVDEGVLMVHAVGTGTTMTLLGLLPEHRDPAFATMCREALIAAITVPAVDDPPPSRDPLLESTVTLRSRLGDLGAELTDGERAIFAELLDRIARSRQRDQSST